MNFDITQGKINTNFAETRGSIINNADDLSNIVGLTTTEQNVLQDNTKSCYFIPGSTNSKATISVTY